MLRSPPCDMYICPVNSQWSRAFSAVGLSQVLLCPKQSKPEGASERELWNRREQSELWTLQDRVTQSRLMSLMIPDTVPPAGLPSSVSAPHNRLFSWGCGSAAVHTRQSPPPGTTVGGSFAGQQQVGGPGICKGHSWVEHLNFNEASEFHCGPTQGNMSRKVQSKPPVPSVLMASELCAASGGAIYESRRTV